MIGQPFTFYLINHMNPLSKDKNYNLNKFQYIVTRDNYNFQSH